MKTAREVREELSALIECQAELLKLAGDIKSLLPFGTKYQAWYTSAYKLVEALAPDRLAEFCSYYLIDSKRKSLNGGNYVIQDYIKGMRAPNDESGAPLWDVQNVVKFAIANQIQILGSLQPLVDSVLQDITGRLQAEILESEIVSARRLNKINCRSAGVLAGALLETHLQRVVANHKVATGKRNPTLLDLNDALKAKEIYDIPTWRKIQFLGDILDICNRDKLKDPTEKQVDELISGVNYVIKNVF